MGFMPSCTTSWTSASFLFPVCHYWPNWLIQVCLIIVAMTTEVRHTWITVINLANNCRQETRSLAEVQEVVQLGIRSIGKECHSFLWRKYYFVWSHWNCSNWKDEKFVFSVLVFDASVFPLSVFWVTVCVISVRVVYTL